MKNPVIERELIGVLRSGKAVAMQLLPAAACALLVLLRWPTAGQVDLGGSQARQVFQLFGYGLLTAILLLVPAFPATSIVRELTLLTGGVAGRRVCAVVGSGDNGGDALWAATFLKRRGASAAAVLLNPERTHAVALAAFRKAGGRVVESVPAAVDLVIDGVVGISGSGPLRPNAAG